MLVFYIPEVGHLANVVDSVYSCVKRIRWVDPSASNVCWIKRRKREWEKIHEMTMILILNDALFILLLRPVVKKTKEKRLHSISTTYSIYIMSLFDVFTLSLWLRDYENEIIFFLNLSIIFIWWVLMVGFNGRPFRGDCQPRPIGPYGRSCLISRRSIIGHQPSVTPTCLPVD